MKQGWEVRTLGDLANVKGGKRVPKGYRLETEKTDYPYIRVTDFNDEGSVDLTDIHYVNREVFEQIKNYTITNNDLYISIAGTIGKTGIIPAELNGANLTENACKLVFKANVDPKFVYYFTKTESFINQAGLNTRIAAMPKLALTRLSTISFLFPKSLPEQQRIVAILDEAFAAIAEAKANAEQNLKNAKELFESYLQSVFENKGDGWEERTLGEVCKVERGSSPRPIDKYFTNEDDGVNWIKIGDTKGVDRYIYTTKQKITKEGALKSRLVEVDDFILSNSMSFGKPYIMKTQGYIHDGWFVLRLPKDIDTEFFWYLLASPYTMNQFISLAAGAIVKNISGDLVKRTVLPIPPLKEQQTIVQKLDALSAETKQLETIYQQKITDLDELKKSILQKAFAGELNTTALEV